MGKAKKVTHLYRDYLECLREKKIDKYMKNRGQATNRYFPIGGFRE